MSFSTRVIAIPAPPVSKGLRDLGFLLWSLPILIPVVSLAASLHIGNAKARDRVNSAETIRVANFDALPILGEPASFARVNKSGEYGALSAMRTPGAGQFPLLADAWKSSAFTSKKIAMKVHQDLPLQTAAERSSAPNRISQGDILAAARSAQIDTGETRTFRRVKVLGATSIQADNLKIILAGIEPMPANANCKRIDGVMQSCIERAEHRLAILLQARSITCKIQSASSDNVYVGSCTADKIDIASDLLKQKLAQRRSATLASN